MKKRRLDIHKTRLLEKLQELSSAIEAKRASGRDFEEVEPDVYDLCVQSYSKEQLFSLCERDRQILNMVQAALTKFDVDAYGICEECEESIEEKRLEALPWVRCCIGCQVKKESGIAA